MPPKALPVADTSADAAELAALLMVALMKASLSAVTAISPPALSSVSSTLAMTRAGFSPPKGEVAFCHLVVSPKFCALRSIPPTPPLMRAPR